MYIVKCWIENTVRCLDHHYTYLSAKKIIQGVRCFVPFGHTQRMAFVDECHECLLSYEELCKQEGYPIKEITEVLDKEPILNEELYQLAFWLKKRTLSTTIACLQLMMTNKKRVKGKVKKVVQEAYVELVDKQIDLTVKQADVLQFIRLHPHITYAKLIKDYPYISKILLKKGIIRKCFRDRLVPFKSANMHSSWHQLSMEQMFAYQTISQKKDIYLLFGQTGSGKTEIYLHLAKKALAENKQVLILVPEISLTPQMINRVASLFPDVLGVYHSALSDQERYEQYMLVKKGKIRIVVGTRSAAFLPFINLGLIVMDEEHDPSYKQDVQPSYHCRDVLIERSKFHHCTLVLGSATPSLESFARAKKGVYQLITLRNRFGQSLADVQVVDMTKEIRQTHNYILSKALQNELTMVLKRKEQAIILLNKRGYSRLLRCKACQSILICPHCDLALTYHAEDKKMKCHSCNFEMSVPTFCPTCKQQAGYSSYGFGTQKLCEEIKHLWSDSKIIRMDLDSTRRKNAHQELLQEFANQEADILVGTQMIAKGLDFPNVTLVAIVNADDGLQRSDYRSSEYTFDLLMQAAGRSGRGAKKGKVILQVYNPEHFAIKYAIKQDYEAFFRQEMKFRHQAIYPPYCTFVSFIFEGKQEDKVLQNARILAHELNDKVESLGIATLLKKRDLYRFRILVKGKYIDSLLDILADILKQSKSDLKNLKIDVDPLYME